MKKEESARFPKITEIKSRSEFVRKCMSALPDWITPNRITGFRGTFLLPVLLLMRSEEFLWASALLGTAIALDFVDGARAEALNMKTVLGAFLDPLVDKILICGTFVGLVAMGYLTGLPPIIIAVLLCIIEGGLIGLRLYKMHRGVNDDSGKPDVMARNAGKYKMILQSVSLLTILLGLEFGSREAVSAGNVMMSFALLLALRSFASHLPRRT
jgi:CDP-diacylglycerol--glycerol-3-phosphate 3-phosphatidyltransferase